MWIDNSTILLEKLNSRLITVNTRRETEEREDFYQQKRSILHQFFLRIGVQTEDPILVWKFLEGLFPQHIGKKYMVIDGELYFFLKTFY